MIWDDKGYLISKFKYNENSVIADFFTLNHGRKGRQDSQLSMRV